jgi:bifunctional UDP-N-acetylglucosamine pyrophosphorylase/glucosamine-1-phosphate N-acetyltransferase
MNQTAAVILAAGQGTRMRSAIPKPLHEIAGRPMIRYVVDAAREAGVDRVIVVVGHGGDAVRRSLPP